MSDEKREARIAIIDNSIDPGIYRPVEHWSRHLTVPWDAFVAREGRFPDPTVYSHFILTGSEASVLERDPWVDVEARIVREAVAAGVAVLGSCWGHQLLAFALAGESHVRRCSRPEIGWVPIRVDLENELLGPAGTPYMFSVHYDEVRDLPASFEILASTDVCPIQAFRLRGKPAWGIQAHPEIDIPTGLSYLQDLIDCDFKGRDLLLEALRQPPRDSRLIVRIVRAFLAAGRQRGV
ncbi:MAG: gamma-glutamyl-gamma-aminobutyrate hydrolase family protein [Candidatus Aminicenantes bacterium]|nr:gamma-glutamyl-gamma-aminobutyrate hydrolase family protein [Candidatus Aminicenantes bacterium]